MRLPLVFSGVIRGVLAALALFIAPVAGIRRTYDFHAYTWCELGLAATAILTGVVSGYLFSKAKGAEAAPVGLGGISAISGIKGFLSEFPKRQGFNTVGCLYIALYTSCAALCVRLGICLLPMHGADFDPFAVAGLIVVVAGAFAMIRAFSLSARIAAMERAYQATHPSTRESEEESTEAPEETLHQHAGAAFVINGQLLAHPVLFSWLLILTGVPLVIGSWLPLVGLPGTFVAMKWKTQTTPFQAPADAADRKVWKLLPYLF